MKYTIVAFDEKTENIQFSTKIESQYDSFNDAMNYDATIKELIDKCNNDNLAVLVFDY